MASSWLSGIVRSGVGGMVLAVFLPLLTISWKASSDFARGLGPDGGVLSDPMADRMIGTMLPGSGGLLLTALLLRMATPNQDSQFADQVIHAPGLGRELLRGAGGFLGVGGVLLCDFVHLRDGRVDLIDPLGLFL